MNCKLACMTLPYSELPFRRALEGIARAGYRYLAFGTTHAGQPALDPAATDAQVLALGQQIADHGLQPVMAFGPGSVTDEGGGDAWRRRLDQACLLKLDCVLAMGPWEYEVWPGKKYAPAVWEGMCEKWYAAMAPVLRHAEAVSMDLVFKPHTGITAYGGPLRQTIERLASPRARVAYDGGNVHYYEGLDPALDIKDCADLVSALCVKDHSGPRANPLFPVPGAGDVDHGAMLAVLQEVNFSGPLAVERFEGSFKKAEMVPALLDGLAEQSRVYLEGLLAELGESV